MKTKVKSKAIDEEILNQELVGHLEPTHYLHDSCAAYSHFIAIGNLTIDKTDIKSIQVKEL